MAGQAGGPLPVTMPYARTGITAAGALESAGRLAASLRGGREPPG